ncbi:MAG: hypothetical protein IPN29_15175 [Saprospiraceae bacterium]|nr:hypothetical protein [Saprospiraceae bacterium]
MKKYSLLFLLLAIAFFQACNDNEEDPSGGTFDQGVFIVNQGKFPDGNSAVTFLKDGVLKNTDAFADQNNGIKLGNTAQSMTWHDDKYFISINNGSSVTVLKSSDFTRERELSNIILPRYFASWGEKLIVSNWGLGGNDGGLVIYNKDLSIHSNIALSGAADKMLVQGSEIYVCLSNGFSVDSLLKVIDLSTGTTLSTYTLSAGPNSVVKDQKNQIWVLCEGHFDWLNNKTIPGALYKISNGQQTKVCEVPQGSADLQLSLTGDKLYFHDGSFVFEMRIDASQPQKLAVEHGILYIYGMALDQVNNKLYLSDPKDFASQGEVVEINLNNLIIKKISTAVAPGQIFIRH